MPNVTRVAYTPIGGTAILAANHLKFPGGWLGFADTISSQTPITTVTDLTSLTLTVTANTARKLRIRGHTGFISTTATDVVALYICDSINNVYEGTYVHTTMIGTPHRADVSFVFNAVAGTQTWKLRAERISGAGTITMTVAGTNSSYLLIEDIGPNA